MPSTLSPADQELIDFAANHELVVSPKQLRVWRERGLLPRNVPSGLGRGFGSTSRVPVGARELVVWLAEHAQRGGRPSDLALRAFADGLPVPERTVRAAFRVAIDRIELEAERSEAVVGIEGPKRAERVADLVVETRQFATLVPARVRRIDDRIRKAGLDGAPQELAQLDRGPSSPEPVTVRDFTMMAVEAILLGGPGIFNQGVGDVARMLAPAGSANPLASIVEHLDEDPEGVSVQDLDGAIPAGDLRDLAREAVETAPAEILKLGWKAVDELHAWAENLCEAVESELGAVPLKGQIRLCRHLSSDNESEAAADCQRLQPGRRAIGCPP
ncbi:hypothetical protein OG500_19225 [Kitasatospora sp. NBC_01250]|uniref:hypothetical protein n=1 Tax=Kitasatospora sp. NBC_01250 TaxID=2903571 RepID=UPI002E315A5F|nr:hypothetical protein [Kitasatospora sp. NBC_01250]